MVIIIIISYFRLYLSIKMCRPASWIYTLHPNNALARLLPNIQNRDTAATSLKSSSKFLLGLRHHGIQNRGEKLGHVFHAAVTDTIIKQSAYTRCATERGVPGSSPPSNPAKRNLIKERFSVHDNIKRFTWLILQPKSANKIGWQVVPWNVWKKKR
jgi:hypothetical protein